MIILKVEELTKRFGGICAVNNLSIGFGRGKITGIIGPNGSGKSTFIDLLTGISSIDKGAVIVNGTRLEKINSCDLPSYGITRTFQDGRLFEQMTVLDHLLVVLTQRSVFKSFFETNSAAHLVKAEEILRLTQLWNQKNQKASTLSYGQRKLLELSRVLAMNTEIILLDEPIAGLYKEAIETMVELLQTLRKMGKTIVLIEHNMQIIEKLCDHVFVMDEGRLIAQGTPQTVLKDKVVIEAYLGE